MEALHAPAALAEYDFPGETQGATQQASQAFYPNDVHPMDRPFFGCLQPCNTALRRIDFVKTKPLVSIGRGTTNDHVLASLRISYSHCQIMWDGREDAQSQVVLHDNSTNGTWINGARVHRGQSCILRDGNEIAFGSPMQQQDPLDDYRYIYRHLAPLELTGIHAHYDIAHELGRGTFATVMKAMSRTTGEWWAVKIIHAQKLRGANANNAKANNNTTQLQSLAREISILETLNHPNICQLRETFVSQEGNHDFYLVLEYVEGGDLLDFILSRNGLSEPMAQHITRQICSALSYIHDKGIAHRDLKPENVLLTKDDPPIVKVADFGLAKVVDSLTMLRTMCGTPNYLAPEVVMESVRVKGYDHLVDSWSVGVIVFSMLTNAGPFIEDEAEPDITRRIAGRAINWEILHESQVSATAESFIRQLLVVDPRTRMSLTDACSHPWVNPSAATDNGTTRTSATKQYAMHRSLSDVSELSELPEEYGARINDHASMLSAEPSSGVLLGVDSLAINSPAPARTRPPLERRSQVLAREMEAEAVAENAAAARAGVSGGGGKRPRSEEGPHGSGSPVDVVTGGESGDSDVSKMEEDSQPRAAKRGRRAQDRQNAALVPPTAVGNGSDNGNGRVLRSRVAAAAGGSRR
ncbi:kinase-like protein [Russula earlei]|uniref:Kinase-like protein n=1 Tax=Russula earlei TaxID=71964 RepID=A0ACC0U0U7_9AGAM|nr:kinase-like protein [Russula earlei]